MYLLRGEVLAFNMVNIIADAIFMLEANQSTHSKEQLSKGEIPRQEQFVYSLIFVEALLLVYALYYYYYYYYY